MPMIQQTDAPKVKIFERKVAPPPEQPGRDKNHTAFRTIHVNKSPVEIEFVYDLDPKDEAGSQKRKEAAFEAALAKKYPSGLKRQRGGFFHYELL